MKRAEDVELSSLLDDIDALNPPSPCPPRSYPSDPSDPSDPSLYPCDVEEEKAPPLPLSQRSRSSSCPEHFVTIPLTPIPARTQPTSPSSSALPIPPASLSKASAVQWTELDLRLQRRMYSQLVARMLALPQGDDEWAQLEERRRLIQGRIDAHLHLARPGGGERQGEGWRARASPPSPRLDRWEFDGCRALVPTFHCPVCLEDCPSAHSVSLPCHHTVCGGCVAGYLQSQLAEGQAVVRCPCYDGRPCAAVLSTAFIAAFTPAAQYQRWLRLCLQKKHSAYRSCPRCEHQQKGWSLLPAMRCDQCGAHFCYHHSNAHPPSVSCRAYTRTQKEGVKEAMRVIGLTTVSCPSCAAPVEKESGCNHMTCSQCSAEFCWLCGERYAYGLHFYELNVLTGCPGMQHAGGRANERRTVCRRLFRALVGWPLTVLLVPLLFVLALALLVAVEAVWLVAFVLALPVVLCVNCCCGAWVDSWQWRTHERFSFWLFLGPKLLQRLCTCY